MTMNALGDMAQLFVSRNHNTLLRHRLDDLTAQLATGEATDLARQVGSDGRRLSAIDHGLTTIQSFISGTTEFLQTMASAQLSLDRFDDARSHAADQMLLLSGDVAEPSLDHAASAATTALNDMVGAMNASHAGRSLFAGAATDRNALVDADEILNQTRALTSGLSDAGDIISAVDDWFYSAGGGFETIAYTGDDGGYRRNQISTETVLQFDVRADDLGVRKALRAAVLGALATSPLPDAERQTLVQTASEGMVSTAHDISQLQARIGQLENRADSALASHEAQKYAWSQARSDLTQIDPYETITELQDVESRLQMHYEMTARLSRLSLAEYI